MTVEQQLQGSSRFGVRAVVVFGVALASAALFGVLLVLVATRSPWVLRLDREISQNLHRFALSHHGFTQAMKVVSDLGSSPVWWTILGVVVAWLAYRRLWRLALFVVVTGVGSSLLNNLIKLLVGRARPNLLDPVAVAAGKAFPSGHAQAAIVGYGILLAVFLPVIDRRWRPLAIALAGLMVLLIGFSRIALGVHYLSDVIGAYLIGTVWLIGLITIFRAWRHEGGQPNAGVMEGLEPEHRTQLEP